MWSILRLHLEPSLTDCRNLIWRVPPKFKHISVGPDPLYLALSGPVTLYKAVRSLPSLLFGVKWCLSISLFITRKGEMEKVSDDSKHPLLLFPCSLIFIFFLPAELMDSSPLRRKRESKKNYNCHPILSSLSLFSPTCLMYNIDYSIDLVGMEPTLAI